MSSRLQMHIQKHIQTSKVACLTKKVIDFQPLTIFAKHSTLDVSQGSEYASGLLKLFCCGSERDTQER